MVSRSGFTLVELLIVIMIIAILSGITILGMGSSLSGAEASKIINDVRDVKAAAMLYYVDIQKWPAGTPVDAAMQASLDYYMDGRSGGILANRYDGVYIASAGTTGRTFIGLKLRPNIATEEIRKKVSSLAFEAGLFDDDCVTPYSGGLIVYTNMK
jgi:general secretion pathway protein G